jgi:hypothetical protein
MNGRTSLEGAGDGQPILSKRGESGNKWPHSKGGDRLPLFLLLGIILQSSHMEVIPHGTVNLS